MELLWSGRFLCPSIFIAFNAVNVINRLLYAADTFPDDGDVLLTGKKQKVIYNVTMIGKSGYTEVPPDSYVYYSTED